MHFTLMLTEPSSVLTQLAPAFKELKHFESPSCHLSYLDRSSSLTDLPGILSKQRGNLYKQKVHFYLV